MPSRLIYHIKEMNNDSSELKKNEIISVKHLSITATYCIFQYKNYPRVKDELKDGGVIKSASQTFLEKLQVVLYLNYLLQ